ncbi:hypothetical protein BC826DRAFT_371386 [Russula brevipes]|nr:hypothetical protein BC826DRAFT_371386 [Russula brevipes]
MAPNGIAMATFDRHSSESTRSPNLPFPSRCGRMSPYHLPEGEGAAREGPFDSSENLRHFLNTAITSACLTPHCNIASLAASILSYLLYAGSWRSEIGNRVHAVQCTQIWVTPQSGIDGYPSLDRSGPIDRMALARRRGGKTGPTIPYGTKQRSIGEFEIGACVFVCSHEVSRQGQLS